MTNQLIKSEQFDFSGGINTSLGQLLTPPESAYKLQNAETSYGGLRKIGGSSRLNATKIGDFSITSLYRAYVGDYSMLLASAGTSMYWWRTSDSSWQVVTGMTGLSAGMPWSFTTYNTKVYATNGYNTPAKITISDVPDAGAMTAPTNRCKQFIVHNEKLWAAVNATNPDQVYYCSSGTDGIGLPETWAVSDYWAFPNESTDERVTGIASYKKTLLGFTHNTITMLYGNTTAEFDTLPIETNIGCQNYRTIKNFDNGVMFMGKDGIYYCDGQRAYRITDDIRNEIDDINQTYWSNCHAVTDQHAYYFFYTSTASSATVNDKMLIFDTRIGDTIKGVIKGAWTGAHSISAGSAVFFGGGTDNAELYYGDSGATGFVHKFMDTTQTSFSASANIDMDVETRDFSFRELGGLEFTKTFEELIVIAEPEGDYDITVQYKIDNDTYWTTLGTVNLAAVGKQEGDRNDTSATRTLITHPLKFNQSTSGKMIRFRLRQNGTGCQCKIKGIVINCSRSLPDRR